MLGTAFLALGVVVDSRELANLFCYFMLISAAVVVPSVVQASLFRYRDCMILLHIDVAQASLFVEPALYDTTAHC